MANDKPFEIHFGDMDLPTRAPFVGPPTEYFGPPVETVELFAEAIREWADHG